MALVRLHVFAHLRDSFAEDSLIEIFLDKSSWTSDEELKLELLRILENRWQNRTSSTSASQAKPIQNISPKILMLAINEKYVEPGREISLNKGDDVALIPPVSGG